MMEIYILVIVYHCLFPESLFWEEGVFIPICPYTRISTDEV